MTEEPRTAEDNARLEAERVALLIEHAEQRHRRDASPLGSEAHRAAVERIGEIEVEVARLLRAMHPPRV